MKSTLEQRIFIFIILVVIPLIITIAVSLILSGIATAFKAIRRSVWYKKLWCRIFPNDYNQYFDMLLETQRIQDDLGELPPPAIVGVYEDYTPWNKEDIVGECDECGEVLLKGDEIPGYSKIYECPSCGHPNGRM